MSIFAKVKKARENKKGFTLVELIVVIVILAILAAILVPALLGWIDRAKEKQVVVNARTVMLAGQTAASEAYAQSPSGKITSEAIAQYFAADATGATSDIPAGAKYTITFAGYKVTAVEYVEGDIVTTYSTTGDNANQWVTEKNDAFELTNGAKELAAGVDGTISSEAV